MTIGAWLTGALTSAADAELGVGGPATVGVAPHGDDATIAGQLADYERRNALKFDQLAAAIAALSEQLEKTAGPSARLVSVDQLARAIKPLEHALERAETAANNDTRTATAGRISSLPGALGG
jgi:hypothetical protein